MKYIIIALLSVCLMAFSGRIVDENGNPIEKVIISDGKKVVLSDKNGKFLIDVKKNTIRIHKIGYSDIHFTKVNDIPNPIILKKKAVEISGVSITKSKEDLKLAETADKVIIEVRDNSGETLAEILEYSPAIKISGVALSGELKTISLSGHKSKHTLIMLDGIPLNASGENFDISTIPSEIIESIEIIKNNTQSGSGSIAGVININTKRSKRQYYWRLNQKFGSFGMQKTQMNCSLTNKEISSYLFASQSITNNDYRFSMKNNLYNNQNYIQNFSLNLESNSLPFQLEYFLFFNKFSKSFLTPENINIFDNSTSKGFSQKHRLSIIKKKRSFIYSSAIYYFFNKSKYDNTESVWMPISNKNIRATKGVESQITYQIKNLKAEFQLNYRKEKFDFENLTNPTADINKVRENYAGTGNIYLTKNIFPLYLEFQLSGRVEKYSELTDFYTFRINTNLKYENSLTYILGGNYGTGFTVPSFYDLFWNDGQTHGNEELLSETSAGYQLFLEAEWQKNYLKLSYNSDKIKNMIHWGRQTDYWLPQNIEKVAISNLELDSKIFFRKYLIGGFSYQRTFAKNKTATSDLYDKFLSYTPLFLMKGSLQFVYKNFSLSGIFLQTGKQYTTTDQLSEQLIMPQYEVVNAEISYKRNAQKFTFMFSIKLNNLLAEKYELYKYMPQPDRNWQSNFEIIYRM